MAVSNSFTYTLTCDQLIQSTFSMMGVYNDGSPPPPSAMQTAVVALNLLIKTLMTKNFNLWCYQDVTLTLVNGQTNYVLGPVPGAAFPTFKPLRIPRARLIYAFPTPQIQVPLIELSREEYNMMGQPGAIGTPNSFYYDIQRDFGNIFLYLTPNAQPNTVILTCQRPLMDMINSTDSFDLPIEWTNTIKYLLGKELIFDFDVPTAKADRIVKRAEDLLEDLLGWDEEDASVFFTTNPQYVGTHRGR